MRLHTTDGSPAFAGSCQRGREPRVLYVQHNPGGERDGDPIVGTLATGMDGRARPPARGLLLGLKGKVAAGELFLEAVFLGELFLAFGDPLASLAALAASHLSTRDSSPKALAAALIPFFLSEASLPTTIFLDFGPGTSITLAT